MLRTLRALASSLISAAVALSLAGCHVNLSTRAEARDQWQRHYPLAKDGTLEIRNTNGIIDVQVVDGDTVDIQADRIVNAATDEAAKDALANFEIKETVSANHIALDSANRGMNLGFNLSRRVEYHVRMPRGAHVRLETTNGDISLGGGSVTGTFRAETTNGRIRASGLENGATASTTNGTITLEVTRLGDNGVSAETTNGKIDLIVPPSLNAKLSARVTNGSIHTEGLTLNVSEQTRRRLDASVGTGGPTITLETTNGAIDVRAAKPAQD